MPERQHCEPSSAACILVFKLAWPAVPDPLSFTSSTPLASFNDVTLLCATIPSDVVSHSDTVVHRCLFRHQITFPFATLSKLRATATSFEV